MSLFSGDQGESGSRCVVAEFDSRNMSPITSFPLSSNAFLSLATVDVLNLRQEVGRGLKQGKMCCIYIHGSCTI